MGNIGIKVLNWTGEYSEINEPIVKAKKCKSVEGKSDIANKITADTCCMNKTVQFQNAGINRNAKWNVSGNIGSSFDVVSAVTDVVIGCKAVGSAERISARLGENNGNRVITGVERGRCGDAGATMAQAEAPIARDDSDRRAGPIVVPEAGASSSITNTKSCHPGLASDNTDWLRVVGPDPMREKSDGLYCSLWVVDKCGEEVIEKWIDVFHSCNNGICECKYDVVGAVAQLKPCRMFAEALCRGDCDPDWEYLLRGVCFGFRVIDSDCVSRYWQGNYSSITKGLTGQTMNDRVKKELDAGLLCEVSRPCACVHPFGAVPKGHDDFRAIVDCSSPSGFCVNEHTNTCRTNFSYNSVESVTKILQEGDYMATVDISDAYRAVNIHPVCRERQGLSWDIGQGIVHLRDNRLCMGLSSSPFVFSKISDFVVRCMVRVGWEECINYLDDFCVVGRSEERCTAAQRDLVAILRRLGFYISFKKLTPSAKVTRFLGIDIDSILMELRLPADKLEKLIKQLNIYMRRRKATRLELEALGGVLAHCCKVVHGGRTFSRRVYDLISSAKKAGHKVRLNEDFRLDLKWWLEFANKFNGKAKIIPSTDPAIAVYSDSSKFGFGALHGEDWAAGAFEFKKSRELQAWLGHHFVFADDAGCRTDNINVLELWPILVGVRRWGSLWKDKTVIFVTDNTQVMAALNSGRSKNKITMRWLRLIFWASINFNFDVQSVYINTKNNVICDSLSRLDKFQSIARIRDADQAKVLCCHKVFDC